MGLLILLSALCLAWQSCRGSQQGELLARLERLEKQEGWRVLVQSKGVNYLDIATRSLTPVHLAPSNTIDASYVGEASFNPDGTRIAFAENWGRNERALIVFDLMERKNEALLTMRYLEGPRWSPRGDEIAFQGRQADRGNFSLYVYHLSDRRLSMLIEKELRRPGPSFCWGPDGKAIVYEDSDGTIWITDLETRKRKKLDRGWFPTWSPNGRYIAYQAIVEKQNPLPGFIIYDLQTGKKESILVGEWTLGSLIWSPDSRYLVHTRASRGFWDYVVAFVGETRYGDLYVLDFESKVEVNVYDRGSSVLPTDWAKTSALK